MTQDKQGSHSYYEYDDFDHSINSYTENNAFGEYLLNKRISTWAKDSIFLADGKISMASIEEYTEIINVFTDKLKSDDPLILHLVTLNSLQEQYK